VATFVIPSLPESLPKASLPCDARIDSWRINVPTERWLIERIVQDVSEGRGGTVFTINLDHLAKLRSESDFRAAYERATYISADGMPVVMLARAEGVPIDRVTGADLVQPLSRAAADAAIPVYFFGTSDHVLEQAVARLREQIPNLVVAGCEAPAMGFDPNGDAARDAACRIAASGAKICFVALGAPKQEIFANTAVCAADGVVYLGIGAALDFLAGHRSRAPRFMQHFGLEWLWRAAQEPRRMVPRYVRSALWLAGYLVRSLFGMTRPQTDAPVDVVCEPRRKIEEIPLHLPMGSREVRR
jgi:exopolysaccharide biosynthesis WecB/TagA/CpsF family protein